MSDHIDPSNLMSYQPSDTEWLSKDPFDILSWDFSNVDQTFDNSFGEGTGIVELEPHTSYTSSSHGSPAEYRRYTIKTEDALSDASPLSDAESETWSPSHADDHKRRSSSSLSPVDNTMVAYQNDTLPSLTTTRNNNNNKHNSRKSSTSSSAPSLLTSSSPSSALTSPKSTSSSSKTLNNNSRTSSSRSTSSMQHHESDAAAVMKRKKAAHNAIEKRYRTNMNAKFLALGNAIPRSGGGFGGSTQLASNKGPRKNSVYHTRENVSTHQHQQNQQQEHQQQNKSEILTNALSYIHELQDENNRLKSELVVLKENLLPRGNPMWRR